MHNTWSMKDQREAAYHPHFNALSSRILLQGVGVVGRDEKKMQGLILSQTHQSHSGKVLVLT